MEDALAGEEWKFKKFDRSWQPAAKWEEPPPPKQETAKTEE